MEQQLQLGKSRILFGSENKEGQVRQKPPVSLPGAKFQSLASPCIQEHVPAIQNPPTPAATPVGKKILKRALPGRAGNCSRFKMEIFEIWKEEKLLSSIIATWRDFSTWAILEYKSWKFLLLYLYVGQDLFLLSPTLLQRTVNSVEFSQGMTSL